MERKCSSHASRLFSNQQTSKAKIFMQFGEKLYSTQIYFQAIFNLILIGIILGHFIPSKLVVLMTNKINWDFLKD